MVKIHIYYLKSNFFFVQVILAYLLSLPAKLSWDGRLKEVL